MASPVIVARAHAATPSSREPFTDGRLARFGPLHRGWAKPPRCSHFPGCAQHADAARRAGPLTPDRARDRHGATLPRPSRPTTDPGDTGRSASTPRRPAPPARPIPRPAPVRGSVTQPQRRGCGISRGVEHRGGCSASAVRDGPRPRASTAAGGHLRFPVHRGGARPAPAAALGPRRRHCSTVSRSAPCWAGRGPRMNNGADQVVSRWRPWRSVRSSIGARPPRDRGRA